MSKTFEFDRKERNICRMWKGLNAINQTALLKTTLDNNYVGLLSHRFYKSKETSHKFSDGVWSYFSKATTEH